MPATLSPQDFVARWKRAKGNERAVAQSHFNDLCELIGQPKPVEADPGGTWFTFEAGASKVSGGEGWADVWKRGHFAWEYKGKHANLDRAYEQLLQYKDSLENPPLLVVCDINRIRIHTNFTNSVKKVYEIGLDDLLRPESINCLRDVFTNPEALRSSQTTEQVTQQAAAEFARLAEQLRKYGAEPQAAAHFLIRVLFCLFAEDVGLLPKDLFRRLIQQARQRTSAFDKLLGQLFMAMTSGGFFGVEEIPQFNGGLFDDAVVLPLDSDALDVLLRVSTLDWSNTEPSVFGTLFERSLDPARRSQLGAHYTSKEDILLIVEPVLMAPWRKRWVEVQAQARDLAARRDTTKGGQGKKLHGQLASLLTGFAHDLSLVQVLDPACGSGNFLYVALRQLLDLEKDVISLAYELGVGSFFPSVSPAQLHGIEINPYAHELAQATIWIGYIQWLRENGYGTPEEPILKPLHNILLMDAVLARDADGHLVEPEWPEADVAIGNPPFLGDKKMRGELGDEYATDLRTLYEGRVPGGADFVTYWFERARALIASGKLKRAGLLATNSIRQQGNRPVLERIKGSGDIFLAWSDRPWILDGAAVRVSMVGFDNGAEQDKHLDGVQVADINPDLTAHADVTCAHALAKNAGLCFLGVMKAGPFDFDARTAQAMLSATGNPNGRPNSDVVKQRLGGQDVVGRPQSSWIIDFVTMTADEAALYEVPFEYVKAHVKPLRDANRDAGLRTRWWLHGRPRPELRAAIAGLSRCIVTPEVAKHRIFVWMDTHVVPDHTLHVIARDDDYTFGVVHSRPHELWSLAQGARMGAGNDPRYSSSRTFETFPFPWPPGQESQNDPLVMAIAQAACELVQLRATQRGARTLTQLYNERPTWLDNAHRKLDEAVFAAYGWPSDLSDDEILARLLALNLERAGV